MKRVIKNILKKPYHNFIKHGKNIRNYLQPTGHILLYHRVAEAKTDPRLLCVSPENFRRQIKFLKENFNIIPLSKMVKDIKEKGFREKSVAITFDDGYADNLRDALPILKKFKVPATIFTTVERVGQSHFYWDRDNFEAGQPLTEEELLELSREPLIEIGAHTLTHPNLANLPEKEQEKEIFEGKIKLEQIINMEISGFAYPFGGKNSFNSKTINLVKKAGLEYACANIHERATNWSNIYALPRFVVRNWNIEEFKKEMGKWI